MQLTLAITWPQGEIREEDCIPAAAQVYGDVSCFQKESH
jgi:hypothetical protein